MANLTQIAESLKVSINIVDKTNNPTQENNKLEGKKRRDWIIEEQSSKSHYIEKKNRFIDNANTKPNLHLKDIRSNPLKLMQYIFELSQNKPDKISEKTTKTDIITSLKLSKDSVKTAIRFLLRNSLIKRIDFRAGKNGWSKFKISDHLFEELELAYKNNFFSKQKPENNNLFALQKDSGWDNIDIAPLEHIGLNKKHILQLKSKNSPLIVQESIFHFAYGLKFNPKAKNYENPLSVFIGVLRKGEAWIEINYKSTQEIAQENIIKNLQAQKERLEKLQEEAFNLAFLDWYNNLTPEMIEQTLQSISNQNTGTKNFIPKKVLLRTYFNQTIWSHKKHSYISS
jgi:hypothetical protein